MVTERMTIGIKGMTCASCVSRVEQALRGQDGVIWARVNFAAQQATLTYDPTIFNLAGLVRAVGQLGYEVEKPATGDNALAVPATDRTDVGPGTILETLRWPVIFGVLAALALVGLYLGLVTIAQDWQHATGLLWGDRWLVAAIAAGFGTQIGLYVHLRRLSDLHHQLGQCKALAATGTGTSSLAMVACCAHHLTDVLPILGLSAAATFLNQYRVPFMLVGLGANVIGIVVMLRLIRRLSRNMQAGLQQAGESAAYVQLVQAAPCHGHGESSAYAGKAM